LHIDPNVFDKLTNLITLFIESNTCINMSAEDNPTAVRNVIQTVKMQCNVEYKKLEQKIKNLEIESKSLNSKNLKEKIENVENEIKNSKFPNFFQDELKDLKAVQASKAQDEATTRGIMLETCSPIDSKVDNIATILKDLKAQTGNGTYSTNSDRISDQCKAFKEDLRNQSDAIGRIDNIEGRIGKIEEKLTKIMKVLKIEEQNGQQNKMKTLKKRAFFNFYKFIFYFSIFK